MTLSELVAVEVMKWSKTPPANVGVPINGIWYDESGAAKDAGGNVVLSVFEPDTNIADAWRVVEKMQTFATGSVERERFEYAFAGLRLDTASSQQAASAICIIALHAVGVSDDRIEKARRST